MTTPDTPPRRVFLCHNRRDRDRVRDVAEALELELGIFHFLDEFAIRAGDEFLRVIQDAIDTSSVCAIFLGSNGWGPTHLWEAERALARYRRDPDFRLIPVLLPGAREEDMLRLGQGTVFRDFNRVELDPANEREMISKLREAVTGERGAGERGPARLTPYIIRRDAARWIASERKDGSLLYRGAELAEAERIAIGQPDATAAEQVLSFLTAAAQAQRRRLHMAIVIVVVVAIAIAGVAAYARRQQVVAESRQMAIEAQIAPQRDRGLLLALAAERKAKTAEARGAQLALLQSMPHLDRFLHGHDAGVRAVAFSADGTRVAAGAQDGRILVWRWRERRDSHVVIRTGPAVMTLRFAAGDKLLVAGDANGGVRVLDLATGQESIPKGWTVAITNLMVPAEVKALAVSHDSRIIAAGDELGWLTIVDLPQREVVRRMRLPFKEIASLDFDPEAKRIAVGGENGKFVVASVVDGTIAEPQGDLGSDSASIRVVRFLDGSSLLTLTSSGSLQTWRTNGTFIEANPQRFTVSTQVVAADFDARNGYIAMSDMSGAIQGNSSADGEPWPHGVLLAHRLFAPAMQFSRDGNWLVSGGVGSEIVVWNLRRPHTLVTSMTPVETIPDQIAWNAEGRVAVALRTPDMKGSWSVVGGHRLLVVDRLTSSTTISPDGQRFAAAFEVEEGVVVAERGKKLVELRTGSAQPDSISVLQFDGQRRRLAIGRTAGEVVLFNLDGAKHRIRESGSEVSGVASLRFSPDGTHLAIGEQDGFLELWRIDEPRRVGRVRAHGGPVFAIAFDPHGRTIVTGAGGGDRGVRFWRARDVRSLGDVPEQHTRTIAAIEFTSDGRIMLSADSGGTIIAWTPDDRRVVGRIALPDETMINALAIEPNGKSFAVNGDRVVYTFALDPAAWHRILCRLANRPDAPECRF